MRLEPHDIPSAASAEELVVLDAHPRAISDFTKAPATSHTRQVQIGTRG